MPSNLDSFKDFFLIFPDSIVFGSLLIGLTTLSIQHGLLFVSFLESFIILFGLQNIFSFIFTKTENAAACKSKFHTLMFGDLLSSTSANNPSYAIYVVSFACSYLLTSFYEIKDELDVLDSSFYKQYTYAFILLLSLPLFYAAIRVFLGCEFILFALTSVFIGAFVGVLIEYQNVQIFGRNATNFLGIPLLRNKSINNEPIYICSK
jgi:hypothetical protein